MGIANRDIENVTLEPYQEASTSNIPDTETIHINNDIHFQPRKYIPIYNLEFDFGSLPFIRPDDKEEDLDDHSYECFFIIDFNDVIVIKWINKTAASVFREWKHDLSEIHKLGGRDVIPEELLHRRDEWEWLCTHFESDKYKRRSVANSSNRGKKELEHHSGRKPIIYWVAELRDKGASLLVVDVYPFGGSKKRYILNGLFSELVRGWQPRPEPFSFSSLFPFSSFISLLSLLFLFPSRTLSRRRVSSSPPPSRQRRTAVPAQEEPPSPPLPPRPSPRASNPPEEEKSRRNRRKSFRRSSVLRPP
ncbi:hypothetical protein ACLB2K_060760 [Fragaria x ananassa]